MNVFKPLTTPEYLFRPSQIVHRFRRALRRRPLDEFATVTLPWGLPLRVRPNEVIGANIYCYGVFDLVVTEAIRRLLDPGETAADIGANIGQMTSLMRRQAGTGGKVISFEPHPELFSELRFNAEEFPLPAGCAPVELHNLALGESSGEAWLDVGTTWSVNRGMARVVRNEQPQTANRLVKIRMTSLDTAVGGQRIDVCKMDVEGFELNVLRGADKLLRSRRIRDLIFEDLDPYPSPVHELLLNAGFTIFSLHSRLLGPSLVPASEKKAFIETKEGRNYLATVDSPRALQRFKGKMWKSLN